MPIALAPLISDGPIIAAVLFVLAQLSKQTLGIIQIAGGLFILYLAYGAYQTIRQAASKPSTTTVRARVGWRGVFKGALMNVREVRFEPTLDRRR